jgi:hypothetical protein
MPSFLFGVDVVLEVDDFAPASGFELEAGGGGACSAGGELVVHPAIAAASTAKPTRVARFI